jgi:hypothetical protein
MLPHLNCMQNNNIIDKIYVELRDAAMSVHTDRHFLQIPGPTNVPDRVLRAIDSPTIDHRGPEFYVLGRSVLDYSQIYAARPAAVI